MSDILRLIPASSGAKPQQLEGVIQGWINPERFDAS